MARFKFFLFLQFVFFSALPVLAQVDTAWVRLYPGGAARALAVDGTGNVYVTGSSNDNYATIKYGPTGDSLWVRIYGTDGFSIAFASALDSAGNVYVTGRSWSGGNRDDYLTIKYMLAGDTLWTRRYNGSGALGYNNDGANALDLDGVGNVYVTGYSYTGDGSYIYAFDYATIKYAPNGDTLWLRYYAGPGNGSDEATALAVDDSGNVYVTGRSNGDSLTGDDYATIKYAPNGETLWVRRYDGPGHGKDQATALVLDAGGNVYVTGYSDGDTSINSNNDYATIKYAPNGETLWVRRYWGGPPPGNYYGKPADLVVDDAGNVYVTGFTWTGYATSYDYVTIKYSSNGDALWVRGYNGPANGVDYASDLAVDMAGNVYVTGSSDGDTTSINLNFDYATIKYSPSGEVLWVKRYNGPGNADDVANAIALDTSGNIYVTGGSQGDYTTIKYAQFTCVDTAGDVNGDGSVTLPDVIYLVNRIFKGGPVPTPLCRGDANADGVLTLPDIIYLVNRVFKGGPAPLKSKECCL